MDVTPGTPAKRSRAKTNEPANQKAAKPTATKKPRASRRKAAVETSAPVTEAIVATAPSMAPSTDDLQGMIATAAYYLAAERNFSPGRELDDWLEAERRIRSTLFG